MASICKNQREQVEEEVMGFNFSERVFQEFADFMLGEFIDSGSSRTVYECLIKPEYVIKVENSKHTFQNVKEWEFWQTWKHDKNARKWLAPCHFISDSGTFLIMERTEPLPKARVPQKVPKFMTDLKKSNFGLLNNKVVCHDYGHVVYQINDDLGKWWGTQ